MILGQNKNLDDIIVLELFKKPNQTAQELTHVVTKNERRYSLQAIYKELRKLITDEVVVKNGPRFHLRLDWVTALSRFSESLFKKSMEPLGKAHVFPPPGGKKEWSVMGFANVMEFVAEIISLAEKYSKDKPHQWHYLIGQKKFLNLKKKLYVSDIKTYMIIGAKTPLDVWASRFWKSDTEYDFSKSPLWKIRDKHINVIGDFIITTKLSRKAARVIDETYNTYRKESDIPLAMHAIQYGCRSEKFHITVENSSRKANSIKAKFKKVFWVKE